ncbi:hypothetical protein N8I77_013066 [Diaporthe amygdali]|uniref:DNA2/NAM7 helicase-like C-terminal domain-containing protein n=1 Tax=Phomopsis amygdali TaxID=1214568 RepID=A0AAD9S267_PHOAM|nr:hypothetical protein N8I77_013066 [Diaporthe amygdali]
MKRIRKTIDHFICETLANTDLVVCTFVVAQSLHHHKLYRPAAVHVDEASREHETLIRWVRIAVEPRVLIITGDFRQDAPFSLVQHVSLKADDRVLASYMSPFSSQYMMPLSQRIMAKAPRWVAYLADNSRQHDGLQDLPSRLFYQRTMLTPFDPLNPHILTYVWHVFGGQLVQENRRGRKAKI